MSSDEEAIGAESERALPVLRALIDSVDRDILNLLARRMGLVAEVAAFKRHHGVPIRDVARERSLLEDRATRGAGLGLSPDFVDSVYRSLMKESRDRQAALRAGIPREEGQPKTVAVIGGEGGMGQSLQRLFADLGHAVMSADLHTELRPVDAAKAADVVVISVPIGVTLEVIRTLGPHVRKSSLLMDVTSIKEAPLQAMLDATDASVIGTHPMFGPGVHSFSSQRVVLCRGRGDDWYTWAKRQLEGRGLLVTEAEAEAHDRTMAIVQVLNHFETQVMGLALARSGVSLDETLDYTSPAYLLEAYVTGRHFAQDPALYGPIEMSNPRTAEVTGTFLEAATELQDVLRRGDQTAFEAIFDEVRGFFGPSFTAEAQEQSRFLIDRLVELTAGHD
ncbi:MAG: bifunctional chorismate mutase/prephenate dehydrogenase [Polyangiales bacterium]